MTESPLLFLTSVVSRRDGSSESDMNKLIEEKMIKKTREAHLNTDSTCIADDVVEEKRGCRSGKV